MHICGFEEKKTQKKKKKRNSVCIYIIPISSTIIVQVLQYFLLHVMTTDLKSTVLLRKLHDSQNHERNGTITTKSEGMSEREEIIASSRMSGVQRETSGEKINEQSRKRYGASSTTYKVSFYSMITILSMLPR